MKELDSWHNKPLDELLRDCRELYGDRDFPTVRRWREGGGKLLGHFQVYFPEEIAHAAGMLPIKIRGATIEPRHADSHFGSYLCSILKTSLELGLSNRIPLDMFVTHPICDAARNLGAVWGRNFPYPCQILYLPQNANSPHAIHYLRNEYERLMHDIEGVVGHSISTERLQQAIEVYNKNRALLRELYAIKRDTPWLLSTEDAYVLMALGGFLLCEDHNDLLETAIPLIKSHQAKEQDKIRVVFEGGFCEQPSLDMLRTMSQYCYVVDDDLLIGLRWIIEDVPVDGDPLHNLAEAYLEKSSYSPVQHDLRKPKEKMLIDRIRAAKADAAIIMAAKMCEPGLEEQVTYTAVLDQERIPYIVSEFEENMTSFDHLEIQLETFVENILFS